MTDIYGPFDNSTWSQTEWARHMLPAMPSGVIGSIAGTYSSGGLALLTSGLNWGLDQGRANVGAFGFYRAGTQVADQAIPANTNATLYRRDRVVLRRSVATNTVVPTRLQGTASATPTAPTITQTDTVWDLPLHSFLVPPASATILSGFIDERGWLDPAAPGVPRFATVAGRDAYFLAPANGESCWTDDAGEFWDRLSGVWAPRFASARAYADGASGTLPLLGGWGVLVNYHTPTWTLSSNGLVTLNGGVVRTAASFSLGVGTPFQFATLPSSIIPGATVSPISYAGLGTTAPANSWPVRIYCPGGSNVLSVVGMDSGSGTIQQNVGYVNLDGVTWRV